MMIDWHNKRYIQYVFFIQRFSKLKDDPSQAPIQKKYKYMYDVEIRMWWNALGISD